MRTPGKGELTFEFHTGDNEERLRELLLYVVEKCGADPKFGATKLNKILFYSDFYSYARFGQPITGVEYMKLPQGPAPRRLLPVQEQLENSGELNVFEKELFNGRKQRQFVARRKPDLTRFSGPELALVDEIIDYLRDQTAAQVSEASHGRAWRIVQMKESIPYESVFISDRCVTDDDVTRAYELAAKYNWAERAS
jgi:hypothetical protein